MMKNKKLILGILALAIAGVILISGCIEKECETDSDCLTKTCFTAECTDNKCVYVPLNGKQPGCSEDVTCGGETCKEGVCEVEYEKNCCGNEICEVGETYPECVADCPNCDDKNNCTVDEYDYYEQECVSIPILDIVCCGNGLCELGETYSNCTRDCPNCDDNNECTADSYDYHEQKCVNEIIVPCCGNGICDEGVEDDSSCPADCPDCDDDNRLTTDSFNYATQKCENPVTHYLFDDFENGTQNWNFYPDASAFSTIVEDGNTVLKGIGHNHAGLQGEVWDDYGLKFRFKRISGFIAVDFRFSPIEGEASKYYIILQQNQQQINIEKGKKVVGHADFEYDDNWHTFEVRGFSNILNVYIDDELLIKYKDTEDPILSGRVTFEVHGGSEYLIDDVEVKIVSEGEVVYP